MFEIITKFAIMSTGFLAKVSVSIEGVTCFKVNLTGIAVNEQLTFYQNWIYLGYEIEKFCKKNNRI
jgi:hypothetical protein